MKLDKLKSSLELLFKTAMVKLLKILNDAFPAPELKSNGARRVRHKRVEKPYYRMNERW